MRKGRTSLGESVQTGVAEGTSKWMNMLWYMNLNDDKCMNMEGHLWSRLIM